MHAFRKNVARVALSVITFCIAFSADAQTQQKTRLNCYPQNSDLDKYDVFSDGDRKGMRSAGQIRIPPEYIVLKTLDDNLFSAQKKSDESVGLIDGSNNWICKPVKYTRAC